MWRGISLSPLQYVFKRAKEDAFFHYTLLPKILPLVVTASLRGRQRQSRPGTYRDEEHFSPDFRLHTGALLNPIGVSFIPAPKAESTFLSGPE